MSRSWRLYLRDAIGFCAWVLELTDGLDRATFEGDRRTFDATVHNLELLGEAVRNLPADLREAHPEVPWSKMIGLRNVLVHSYFGVEREVVWDIVSNRIAPLHRQLAAIEDLLPPGEGQGA